LLVVVVAGEQLLTVLAAHAPRLHRVMAEVEELAEVRAVLLINTTAHMLLREELVVGLT
jgi:hypothetical protein